MKGTVDWNVGDTVTFGGHTWTVKAVTAALACATRPITGADIAEWADWRERQGLDPGCGWAGRLSPVGRPARTCSPNTPKKSTTASASSSTGSWGTDMDDVKTVAWLRQQLAGLPDDLPVVLAEDTEGNGFDTLWKVETTRWWPAEQELVSDEDGGTDGVACVVLWP